MSAAAYQVSAARSILDAATSLFACQGFEPVSMSQIASQARVSKSNVYHHFESKKSLYLAVMREAAAVHADYAEALFKENRSSESKIRDLAEFEVLNLLENEERTRLLQHGTADRAHRQVEKLAEGVFDRNFMAVVSLFEQGIARREFRKELNPAAAAMLMHGSAVLFFQCHDVLRRFPKARAIADAKGFAKALASIVISGAIASPAHLESRSIVRKTAARRGSVRK